MLFTLSWPTLQLQSLHNNSGKYFENIADLEDRALFLEGIKPFQSSQSTMYQIRRRNIPPAPSVQGRLFII